MRLYDLTDKFAKVVLSSFALRVAEDENQPDDALKITFLDDFVVAGLKTKRSVDDENSMSLEIGDGVKVKFERP